MIVAAEYLRYGLTTTKTSANTNELVSVNPVATELFRGQSLLHNVTGLKGLCARSACGPTDKECAPGRATDLDPACQATPSTCGLQWRNGSAAAGYGDGWVSEFLLLARRRRRFVRSIRCSS